MRLRRANEVNENAVRIIMFFIFHYTVRITNIYYFHSTVRITTSYNVTWYIISVDNTLMMIRLNIDLAYLLNKYHISKDNITYALYSHYGVK